MPYPKAKEDPQDMIVSVRYTRPEKEYLKRCAEDAGITMSELIRRWSLGRQVVAHADEVLIRELRRLGGLLKHVHNESRGAYSREISEALKALTKYLEEVSQHDLQES